jgi:hypothetical protein
MKKTSIIALLCCFNTVQSHPHSTEKTTSISTQPDGTVIKETTIQNTQDGVHTKTHIIETIKPQGESMLGGDGLQPYCGTVSPNYRALCCAQIKSEGKEYNDKNKEYCSQFDDQDLQQAWENYQVIDNNINDDER